MVEPHSSNFRVITTNFWGVWIFRKFMVYMWYKIEFSKILENCYSLLKTWFLTPQRNVFHFPFIAGSVLKNNFKYWRWFSLQIDAGSVYNFLNIYIAWCLANEPRNDKTNKISVCPAKTQISLGYPLSPQRRLWSDWVDAQADLSLRWTHTHFVGFVMRRLKCLIVYKKSMLCEWNYQKKIHTSELWKFITKK